MNLAAPGVRAQVAGNRTGRTTYPAMFTIRRYFSLSSPLSSSSSPPLQVTTAARG
jgi:hypothetical protein